MDETAAAGRLAALAQPTRLRLLRLLLAAGGRGIPAGDLARRLGVPASTLSFHLRALEEAGFARSARDGRRQIYAARPEAVADLVGWLSATCCDGRPGTCLPSARRHAMDQGSRPPFEVLFLCTHNSGRSIMAECILNREGGGRFRAHSAGSHPSGRINPDVAALLRRLGYDLAGLRSKGWDEFAAPGAPRLDFVITVCDDAAGEICPIWPGQPITAHWGVPDPSRLEGDEAARGVALAGIYRALANRIGAFVALPVASLDRMSLQRRMEEIGRQPRPASASGAAAGER